MSNYPTAIDAFPTVLATDTLDTAGKELDVLLNALFAAVVAQQTRVGIAGSADASSLEYRLTHMASTLYALGIPRVLWQSGIPFVLPAGDGGANGLSFTGTAGQFTLSAAILSGVYAMLSGCYLYLPAGAGGLGSGGWYWATFTSDTGGEVYQETYTPGSGTPLWRSSPTPHPNLTAGRITQTTSEITAVTFTLPAGAMGPNGICRMLWKHLCSTSASSKTSKVKAGSSVWALLSPSSAFLDSDAEVVRQNQGVTSRQNGTRLTIGASNTTYSGDHSTVDTSVDQTISVTMQIPAADSLIVVPRQFSVIYGG